MNLNRYGRGQSLQSQTRFPEEDIQIFVFLFFKQYTWEKQKLGTDFEIFADSLLWVEESLFILVVFMPLFRIISQLS